MGSSKIVLFIVLVQIFSEAYGGSFPRQESENEVEKGINMLYNVYRKCGESEDMFSCLKIRALKFADRAIKVNNIPLFVGMSVVRNEEAGSRAFSAPDFDENALPQDPEKKQETLDDLLVDRVTRFLKTHSVQFDLPKLVEDDKNEVEEGRGKMKKYIGPLIFAAMMKGGMFAYAMKAVGILAAKALLVSKVALVLASVIGIKKLFSHGHSESKTIEIVQKPQISHAHTYSSGHDFGGYGGGGAGWEASGHGGGSGGGGGGGGGYGRSLEASVPETKDYEAPVGNGIDASARRSFDSSVPFPQAHELAYRGRVRHQQQQ